MKELITTKNVDRNIISPMMLEYAEQKDKFPNDLVLFRVGDFYEAYFEDAVLYSQICGLTLTSKKMGDGSKKSDENCMRVPMAGTPWKALSTYADMMINAGYRVVIVEQLENPKEVVGRNLKRGVIKIMSSVDLSDEHLIEYANNFLCTIYREGNEYGLCFADILTGDIYLTTVDSVGAILNEISRYKPSEIVMTKEMEMLLGNCIETKLKLKVMITIDDSLFDIFDFISPIEKSFSLDDWKKLDYHTISEIKSLYILLKYVEYTQKMEINFGSLPHFYTNEYYMSIDIDSKNNLELCENIVDKGRKGTLLSVLDRCKTRMGSRMLKQWIDKPLLQKGKIENRLEAISELVADKDKLSEIQDSMTGILDISRIMGKLKLNRAIPKDLVNLRSSLHLIPKIQQYLSVFNSDLFVNLNRDMVDFQALTFLLDSSLLDDPVSDIREGLVLKQGYNNELDKARDMIEHSNRYLIELEELERDKTGIKNLKMVNKNGKCTFEVLNSQLSKVPSYFRIEKTLKNCVRYVTDDSERLEKELFSAEERSKSIEIELYEELKKLILDDLHNITLLCNVISTFDVICSLARVAVDNNYVRPFINMDDTISIEGGRHPIVERMTSEQFVSNNVCLDKVNNRFILLTGPNMAGKSTYMRQVALITVMAHIGSYVPADYANICIVDKVFTRIGASDDISSGRSTYMVEMTEVKNILDNATNKSLVLLDEVGRGTSTSDGLAIANAITEHIHNEIGCKTMFATHYHELISLEDRLNGLRNYHLSVSKDDNDNLVFNREVKEGGLSESYGIDVAKLAGLPNKVIDRAWDVLEKIENDNVFEKAIEDSEEIDVVKKLKSIDKASLTPTIAYKLLFDLIGLVE